MRILRLRCGNNSSGESNIQKRSQGPRVRFLSSSSDFIIIVDVLLGPFLHIIPPHDYLLFVHPHLIMSATSHAISVPNDRPSFLIALSVSELPLIPPLTTGYKVPFLIQLPFSTLLLLPRTLATLFFSSLQFFPLFRTYVTRCHLEPPSTFSVAGILVTVVRTIKYVLGSKIVRGYR